MWAPRATRPSHGRATDPGANRCDTPRQHRLDGHDDDQYDQRPPGRGVVRRSDFADCLNGNRSRSAEQRQGDDAPASVSASP
jgi:hypothetical protein